MATTLYNIDFKIPLGIVEELISKYLIMLMLGLGKNFQMGM